MRREPVVFLSIGCEHWGWAGEVALAASCWVFTEEKSLPSLLHHLGLRGRRERDEEQQGSAFSHCRLWQTLDLWSCRWSTNFHWQWDTTVLCRASEDQRGSSSSRASCPSVWSHLSFFFSAWWQATVCQEMVGPEAKAELFFSYGTIPHPPSSAWSCQQGMQAARRDQIIDW